MSYTLQSFLSAWKSQIPRGSGPFGLVWISLFQTLSVPYLLKVRTDHLIMPTSSEGCEQLFGWVILRTLTLPKRLLSCCRCLFCRIYLVMKWKVLTCIVILVVFIWEADGIGEAVELHGVGCYHHGQIMLSGLRVELWIKRHIEDRDSVGIGKATCQLTVWVTVATKPDCWVERLS